MPRCHSYCRTQEPKNRGCVWKLNEPLGHFRGFERFNKNLFSLPNSLCYGGEEGIFIAPLRCRCSGFTCFAHRWVLQWSHLSQGLAAVRAPRLGLAQERGGWKIPALPSAVRKMLLPQFRTGDSYSSCPLLKFNFIALPNNLAAKAADESEERRLMQYMLSLSTGLFVFFLLSNCWNKCHQWMFTNAAWVI